LDDATDSVLIVQVPKYSKDEPDELEKVTNYYIDTEAQTMLLKVKFK
jgi:hypothetical protein